MFYNFYFYSLIVYVLQFEFQKKIPIRQIKKNSDFDFSSIFEMWRMGKINLPNGKQCNH